MCHRLVLLGCQAPPRRNHCGSQRAARRALAVRYEIGAPSSFSIPNSAGSAAFARARTSGASGLRTIYAPCPVTNSSVAMEFEIGVSKSSRSRVLCWVASWILGVALHQIESTASSEILHPWCVLKNRLKQLTSFGLAAANFRDR